MTPEELADELVRRILGDFELSSTELLAGPRNDPAMAAQLWTGLGFAPVDPQQRVFTAADAEVLDSLRSLSEVGIAGPEVVLPMTRVLGQALSRVANAQVHAFRPRLLAALDDVEHPGDLDASLEAVTELLLPVFERFIAYTWRRHLADALRRELVEGTSHGDVVGFADLVGFTRETRAISDTDLSRLLSRFQDVVYEQVTAVDGRIVKTLGDGIMFAAPTATGAARAALGTVAACALDGRLPGVRVGLAHGHLVALEGDLFGETVNRASRLCDLARAHTVVADDETGEALVASGEFTVKRMAPRKLKGLGAVPAWVVRPPRL